VTTFSVKNQLHYIEEDLAEGWVAVLVEMSLSWFTYWEA
jgi:hypothetical protein